MIQFNRRGFLQLVLSNTLLASQGIHNLRLTRPELFIGSHDWLDIPYETQCFEIIGSTNFGMKVLPNIDRAIIKETERLCGIQLGAECLYNLDRINGCGLFVIYLSKLGSWQKFRFWNYIDSEPPEYPVTVAV